MNTGGTIPARYWDGVALTSAMRPVLAVLAAGTGSAWEAEHTGGGCHWLATYDVVPGVRKGDGPLIAVTGAEPLGWDDTPDTVRNAWTIGLYLDPAGGGEPDLVATDVADEALPVIAREFATVARETASVTA